MRIAAYQLLDFYHVAEHLQTFADAAFSQGYLNMSEGGHFL